ncbi:VWA domain-containing protein, partial [Pseudomonas sp. 10B1]|uniref:vWA domain-containing protein n=1 Tax=Pseudomonas sp. 10B1 TaxID=3048573 RepID=UPI002B23DFA7
GRAGRLGILAPPHHRAARGTFTPPAPFHAVLLGGGRGRASKMPWLVLGLGWTLAVLALLGPSWQRVEQISQKPADPLVVMLELTPEMLATDTPPTRVEQARRKLLDLLQSRSESQTAIVVYAGSAHTLVPLSDDLGTSRNLLDALKPSIMPEAGHRADLAVKKALALLKQGAQGQGRLLWIGSSLNEQEREGILQVMGRDTPPLLLLGIGTAEGVPVAQEKGGFLKDDQGAILLPRLDGVGLKDFASQVDGLYRQARVDESDLRGLGLLDSPQRLRKNGQTLHLDSWDDQGAWLILPLLLLAGCAGRRGWLFCLPLLFMLPQPSYAFELNDLWLRPDQQGQYLLEESRPAEAARRFEDSQWKGVALYDAGDYTRAAQRFAEGNTAADHYNRGNALAKAGELEAALDAYEQALERQPDLKPALANKALVEQVLEQRKQRRDAELGKSADSKAEDLGRNAQPGATIEQQTPQQPTPPSGDDTTPQDQGLNHPTATAGGNDVPGSQLDDEATTRPPIRPGDTSLDGERRQALEQWLRQIPDDPGELLRRKFWYEQQQHQGPIR